MPWYTVKLMRTDTPTFPDRCVVCKKERPGTTTLVTSWNASHGSILDGWHAVSPPACSGCGWRLFFRSWLLNGFLIFLALLIGIPCGILAVLAVGHEWAPEEKPAWWWWVVGVAVGMVPAVLMYALARAFPLAFSIDHDDTFVTYCFSDQHEGEQFGAANGTGSTEDLPTADKPSLLLGPAEAFGVLGKTLGSEIQNRFVFCQHGKQLVLIGYARYPGRALTPSFLVLLGLVTENGFEVESPYFWSTDAVLILSQGWPDVSGAKLFLKHEISREPPHERLRLRGTLYPLEEGRVFLGNLSVSPATVTQLKDDLAMLFAAPQREPTRAEIEAAVATLRGRFVEVREWLDGLGEDQR
jgi:hypothetical protein